MHNHQKGCNCNEHATTQEVKDDRCASFVFGILSVCLFWVPITGLLMGIIGMSIKKNTNHRGRDIALNAIGLSLGSFVTMIYFIVLSSM